MATEYTEIYAWSKKEAERVGQLGRWQKSHLENVACKDFITQTLEENYKDNRLHQDSAEQVLERFGYKRLAYVLANSINEKIGDGRFSNENRIWAKGAYITKEKNDLNKEFAVDAHPAILNGFVNQYRRAYEKLGMFDLSQCIESDEPLDYTNRVIVVKSSELGEQYFNGKDQIYLATSGFGCEHNKIGRAVFTTCLGDGVKVRWDREQILGALKDECIPDYAKEMLSKIEEEKNKKIADFQSMHGVETEDEELEME